MININEIKNQHVHLFWGLMAEKFVQCYDVKFYMAGLVVGIFVELYQVIFKKEKLFMLDRLVDITFWWIGSLLIFII
jgi:hypothetical protein